jgi:hypothetical protein
MGDTLNRLVRSYQLNPGYVEPRKSTYGDKKAEKHHLFKKEMNTYQEDNRTRMERASKVVPQVWVQLLLPVPFDCVPNVPGCVNTCDGGKCGSV